jgi:hypothetical protein
VIEDEIKDEDELRDTAKQSAQLFGDILCSADRDQGNLTMEQKVTGALKPLIERSEEITTQPI